MTRKLITFLGKASYREVTYRYKESSYTTRFFAEAALHFVPPVDEILLFVTQTVKEHNNYYELTNRLQGYPINEVLIPETHSETDLWEIFDRFIDVVQPNDALIFDITNSFRTIPFLVFLAAAYLHSARNVSIERILYGAYEARNEEGNIAPVFDLTPFAEVLSWLEATNQFIRTGDARDLASQLKQPEVNSLQKRLENLSSAMLLNRPLEVMKEAARLKDAIGKTRSVLQEQPQLHPFLILLERIEDEYGAHAVPHPERQVRESLVKQYQLIQWYLKNRHIIQAVTLAREWVITVVGWKRDTQFLIDKQKRGEIEELLGQLKHKEEHTSAEATLEAMGLSAEEIAQLKKTWSHLSDLRNDIAHSGMRKGAKSAKQVIQEARKGLQRKLSKLAELWEFI